MYPSLNQNPVELNEKFSDGPINLLYFSEFRFYL